MGVMVKRRKPIDKRSYNRMRSSKKTRRRQAGFSSKKIKKIVINGFHTIKNKAANFHEKLKPYLLRAKQIIKRFLKLARKRALQIYAKILQSNVKERLVAKIKTYKKLAIKYIRKVTDKKQNTKSKNRKMK